MKWVTFHQPDAPNSPRLGVLAADEQVLDLVAAAALRDGEAPDMFGSMLAMLDAGVPARHDAERLLEYAAQQRPPGVWHVLSDVALLAPLPRPRSIRDCLAFQGHLEGCAQAVLRRKARPLAALDRWITRRRGASLTIPRVWFERPIYYKGNPQSVVGHEAPVRWPSYTEQLDFELEFGVVLGRTGRDIPIEEATDYIAGYTIFNDFSARDVQFREMQGRLGPAKGKDFDTGNVLGPYLVTPDEVGDPYDLPMRVRVNGETWATGHSGQMRFTFEQMISYISQDETLVPGEFIGSGTIPGGCGLELDRWLQPGDVVELEVERLGVLRNRIVRD
jgi:2-keto-4-pentenoate hydratase/2-oxohepta-3-ene-1,7-dioic acid hydratase in catechol pathway